MKRFQVGTRFAGMKGPCPSCGTVIAIPTETVKVHGIYDGEPTKKTKQTISVNPFPRIDWEFDHVLLGRYALIVFGVLLLTFVFGCIPMYAFLRSVIGFLGLCLVAFPLTLFGYESLRDKEIIFAFSGEELYRRAGITAAGYVVLWLVFECFLWAVPGGSFISTLYFFAFAVLGAMLSRVLLELKTRDAFLHFCIFGVSVAILRYLVGLGWFGIVELHRHTAAPPAPLLPGM
jgi:hypothetical protein